mgnify:CR=1 FL=1
MSSYKNCNLKREMIESTIHNFVGDMAVICPKLCDSRITYSIQFKDKCTKTALLLVYYNQDGTTTLMYGSGKNQEYSKTLADEILDKTTIQLINVSNLYFRGVTQNNVEELKQKLSDIGCILSDPTTVSNGIQYHVKSVNGEAIHFIWYSNSAILFQGRPSFLFNQTIEFLLEYFPPNDVVKEVLGYYRISIPQEDVRHELETRYSNLNQAIDDKLKAIILPALALKRTIPENLTDYSYIAYPVLRGLEGVLKSMFNRFGILIDSSGFGEYFKFNHVHQKWEVSELTLGITNNNIHQKLVNLYTLYNNKRHSLFHVDSLTPILTSQEEALSIVDEILNALDHNI